MLMTASMHDAMADRDERVARQVRIDPFQQAAQQGCVIDRRIGSAPLADDGALGIARDEMRCGADAFDLAASDALRSARDLDRANLMLEEPALSARTASGIRPLPPLGPPAPSAPRWRRT
jgi:hypothetical protein